MTTCIRVGYGDESESSTASISTATVTEADVQNSGVIATLSADLVAHPPQAIAKLKLAKRQIPEIISSL